MIHNTDNTRVSLDITQLHRQLCDNTLLSVDPGMIIHTYSEYFLYYTRLRTEVNRWFFVFFSGGLFLNVEMYVLVEGLWYMGQDMCHRLILCVITC